ncbi:MAG: GNAT family N-acetyltransferase [Anaerolineae bacterium]|nr:GNAT family N-acetyltransferase [Anaerolineae bacterium]
MCAATLATLTIRRAQESDRADIESIAGQIWRGMDYLPMMFDRWLADAEGAFYIAEFEDRVVGTAKLSRLSDGEWWLEGLRVHPDLQGQGIGRRLHHAAIEQALQIGSGVLRFSTDEDYPPTHHYAAETGFVRLRNYLLYETRAYSNQFGADTFHALTAAEVPSARNFLTHSALYEYVHHSTLGRQWKAYQITDERLLHWAADQLLYGWHATNSAHALSGLAILGGAALYPSGRTEMDVIYLDAEQGRLAQIARSIRGLAARLGYDRLRHMLPVAPDRLVALEQGGWRRPKDNRGRAVLFGRSLDASG